MAPPPGDAVPAKKRRSFFSSRLNITPNLPAATASRAPVVTSSEVLAALSAPEEVVVKRKEPKQKAPETSTSASTNGTPSTPTPAEIAPANTTITTGPKRALRVKPSPLDTAPKASPPITPAPTGVNGHATATDSGRTGRTLRARPSIQYSELGSEDTKDKVPLSPPLTSSAGRGARPKRHSHSGIPASSTSNLISTPAMAGGSGSGSGRGRHAAKNGGVAPAPLLRTPTMASRRGYKPPPETSGSLPNTTGKRGGKNAQHAQSVNERLSLMMLANIRATIGGREESSPVQGKGATVSPRSKATVARLPVKLRKTQTTMAMTARQKAKLKAEKVKRIRGKGKRVENEEEEDDVMDDDEDERFEDMTSSDDDAPAKGKGRGRRTRTNGTYTKDEKGKGRAKETGRNENVGKRNQQQDDGGVEKANLASTSTSAAATSKGKQYMTAGFYCQDANAKSPYKLINKILGTKKGGSRRNVAASTGIGGLSFPPLPYDHGYEHFFGREHDFVLPFNIHNAASNGALNDKKKPAPYQKVRGNVFPDRARVTCERVVCECAPDSGCGDNCINRIMSYLCGRDCPCGESCTNRSLAKRPMAETKVKYTGSRGFGLFAMQDIKEGDFVTDYRGEVISLDAFHERLVDQYAGQRNFYALAYDQDEVIDSGLKGNDARFINHGCDPNLEVRKYQQVGDGLQEFEVGMWALKNINKGDELFYNYNFDWFAEAKDSLRAECRCGAANCIGVLGRRNGDVTAKELAAELEAKRAAEAVKKAVKGKRGPVKKVVVKKTKKTGVTTKLGAAIKRAKMSVVRSKTVVVEPETVVVPELSTSTAVPEVEHAPISTAPTSIAPISPGRIETSADGFIDVEGEEEIDELDSDDGMEVLEVGGAGEAGAAPSTNGDWENRRPDGPPGPEVVGGKDSANGIAHDHDGSTAVNPSARTPNSTINPAAASATPSTATFFSHTSYLNGQVTNASPGASSSSALPRPNDLAFTTPEFVPDPSKTPEENAAAAKAAAAAAKRKSGWTSWLRKIAAEKTRTLEEWHEERIKRRRGIAWMNMMIAEFGVAPSPLPLTAEAYSDGRKPAGSVASFANTLAAQGHGPGPQAVKNLGGPKNYYRSDNWGKTKEENMKYMGMTPAPDSVRGTPGSASGSASAGAAWHGTPGSAASARSGPRLPSVDEGSPSASTSSGQGKRPRTTDDGNAESNKRGRTMHDGSLAGLIGPEMSPAEPTANGARHFAFERDGSGPSMPASSRPIAQPARPLQHSPSHEYPRLGPGGPFTSGEPSPMFAGSLSGGSPHASPPHESVSHYVAAPSTASSQSRPVSSRPPSHPAQSIPHPHSQLAPPRSAEAVENRPKSLGPFWKTAPTAAEPRAIASPGVRAAPATSVPSTARPQPPLTPAALPKASEIAAAAVSAPKTTRAGTPSDVKPNQSPSSHTPTHVRETEKKKAIKKRNGAPMGWAYEPLEPAVRPPTAAPEELGRGARRARHSLPAGA